MFGRSALYCMKLLPEKNRILQRICYILGELAKIRDEACTLDIPVECPPLLKEIMKMCWKKNPNDRLVSFN